jgi:hypothetical protein
LKQVKANNYDEFINQHEDILFEDAFLEQTKGLVMNQYEYMLNQADMKAVLNSLYSPYINPYAFLKFGRLQVVKKGMNAIDSILVNRTILREYVVKALITELITRELMQQRRTHLVFHRWDDSLKTRQQAISDIECDAQVNSKTLLGWSLLYHLNARPEFNFTQREFAAIAHVHQRSLRRCKDQVTDILLQRVIDLEVEAQGRSISLTSIDFREDKSLTP